MQDKPSRLRLHVGVLKSPWARRFLPQRRRHVGYCGVLYKVKRIGLHRTGLLGVNAIRACDEAAGQIAHNAHRLQSSGIGDLFAKTIVGTFCSAGFGTASN
jgi:hypothetical protein